MERSNPIILHYTILYHVISRHIVARYHNIWNSIISHHIVTYDIMLGYGRAGLTPSFHFIALRLRGVDNFAVILFFLRDIILAVNCFAITDSNTILH